MSWFFVMQPSFPLFVPLVFLAAIKIILLTFLCVYFDVYNFGELTQTQRCYTYPSFCLINISILMLQGWNMYIVQHEL